MRRSHARTLLALERDAEADTELTDLITLIEREREAGEFPELDSEHYLIHQLHFLSAEDVRRVSVLLADDLGMLAD